MGYCLPAITRRTHCTTSRADASRRGRDCSVHTCIGDCFDTRRDHRVTHSCHLIEIGGKTILTDPWFTKKPHYDQGEPIAFTIDELPALDAVLITHAHYDHCDLDASAPTGTSRSR
jgi:phosphoribosyl 1,2-cyclic phosphodiesterase